MSEADKLRVFNELIEKQQLFAVALKDLEGRHDNLFPGVSSMLPPHPVVITDYYNVRISPTGNYMIEEIINDAIPADLLEDCRILFALYFETPDLRNKHEE